jgi:ATPase associated with various cellular activities AAA_5
MIYISKFRSNDLNPSKGKQIEFNKGVIDKFFNFTTNELIVNFECHSILDTDKTENIRVELKLSPSRGDYKIYQNSDGSRDLKDYFLETLQLKSDSNLDDYFAIKKKTQTQYILYYLPKDIVISRFFTMASSDQFLYIPEEVQKGSITLISRQIIFYGAPGTGKSHKIKEVLGEYEGCPENKKVPKSNIFRTTFHPDSDYSTFVGAYKPTKGKKPLYGLNGGHTVRLNDGKDDLDEDIITYKFVPQAFLNAYIQAYRKPKENVYLIIEEINRGNCAQIFGDLFQLLDRDRIGKSEYTIKADAELKTFLENELGEGSEAIKDGELCLPPNLYIYATMNTSDQSLFPIDSAFKRRWDWEYEPIKYKNTDWVIDIEGLRYRWSDFQKEVNTRILKDTGSEDKMLGDYFVNPSAKVISYDLFRNKILFYLWNDVCKDGDADIFPTDEDFSFSKLYDEDSKRLIVSMMDKLGLKPIDENGTEDNEDDMSEDDDNRASSVRYSINGEETDEKGKAWGKGALVKRAVEIYCNNHAQDTAAHIRDVWMSENFIIPHIVETDEDREQRIHNSSDPNAEGRSKEIKLPNGESLHVSTQVGDGKQRKSFSDFLSKIKSRPEWGIDIQEL